MEKERAWWNGRHKRLKISRLRLCRFESGRPYHNLMDRLIAEYICPNEDATSTELKQAGFLLNNNYPNFAVPIQGTLIRSEPFENGRIYRQYKQ